MNKNSSDIFEKKRNNLLDLLNDAQTIYQIFLNDGNFSSLAKNLKKEVDSTMKRCKENLFSIVLIAPFQTGKSTTITAFANGREISPRGLGGGGIKTSACLVKIHNSTSDDNLAQIIWRSKEDLMSRIMEFLGGQIAALYKKEKNRSADTPTDKELMDFVDISTSTGIARIKSILNTEKKIFNEVSNQYNEERLDFLKFALLVTEFYNEHELQALRKQSFFSIEIVNKYIQFPRDLRKRWLEMNPSKFSLSEAIYVFIDEVIIPVSSKALEKNGTAIVDAPGLFISRYDTQLAMKAMDDASSVFYLFTGEKEPSEEDKKVLTKIKASGIGDKVIFGVNFRKTPEQIERIGIADSIRSLLKELKYDKPHQTRLFYYNAVFAMRALQGKAILSDTLDHHTKLCIEEDAQILGGNVSTVEEAWMETTDDALATVRPKGWRQFMNSGLCEESVTFLHEMSLWTETSNAINDYIFTNRARSVLIDQGAKSVIKVLRDADESLESKEKNTQQTLQEQAVEYQKALKLMDEFIRDCEGQIANYITDQWERELANDFYDSIILQAIQKTSDTAAPKIREEVGVSGIAKNIWTKTTNVFRKEKKAGMEEICANIIKQHFNGHLEELTLMWKNTIKKKQNKIYSQTVEKNVLLFLELIKRNWKDIDSKLSILKNLDDFPKITGNIFVDIQSPGMSPEDLDTLKGIAISDALKQFGLVLGAGAVGVGVSMVGWFGLDLLLPGLGIIMVLITATMMMIFHEESIEKIRINLHKSFVIEMNNKSKEIKSNLQTSLKVIREYYEKLFKAQLQRMKKKLENRIKSEKEFLEKSLEKREKIAEVAKKYRTKYILPLRIKLDGFEKSVDEIWPE